MKSIRRRLALSLSLAMVVVMGAGAVAVYRPIERALREEFDQALEAKLLAAVEFVVDAKELAHREPADTAERFEQQFELSFADAVQKGTADVLFQIWDASGHVVFRSPPLGERDLAPPPLPGGGTRHYTIVLPDGREARATATRPPGAVYPLVIVARDYEPVLGKLASLRWLLFFVAAASVLVALALGRIVLGRGLAPLEVLGQAMSNHDGSRPGSELAAAELPSELKPFVARVDELVRSLDSALARERRFNAAIAHELRTPVAELRATTEIALSGSPDEAHAALRDVDEVGRHLENLVLALLTMRRGQFERGALHLETIDLAEVASAAARRATPAALARRLEIAVRADGTAPIASEPSLVRAIVDHLVDNAVEYAPEGTTVEIDTSIEENEFVLRVRNVRPPQLAGEDVARFFEPFERREPRARDRHTGLGLVTTRAFVERIGGTITAREREQWIEVEVRGAARAAVPV